MTVVEDEQVTFECELSKPGQTVEWIKDGKPLVPDERTTIKSEGAVHQLTIDKTKVADSAQIAVKIPTAKSSAKLTVKGRF